MLKSFGSCRHRIGVAAGARWSFSRRLSVPMVATRRGRVRQNTGPRRRYAQKLFAQCDRITRVPDEQKRQRSKKGNNIPDSANLSSDVWSRDLLVRVVHEPGRLVRPGFADGLIGCEAA